MTQYKQGKINWRTWAFIRRVYLINDQKLHIRINSCWMCQKYPKHARISKDE